MLADGLGTVVESQTLYNEKLEEQEKISKRNADTERSNMIKALGDIGRLRAELAEKQDAFIAANSEAERVAAQIRINELEKELELLVKIAQTRALTAGQAGPVRAASAPGTLDTTGQLQGSGPAVDDAKRLNEAYAGLRKTISDLEEKQLAFGDAFDFTGQQIAAYEATVNRLIETGFMTDDIAELIAELNALKAAQDGVTDSTINWRDASLAATSAIGAAFGAMVSGGKKSTSDILKQALAQSIAYLLPSILKTVPFPASLAVAAGVPAITGALFSKIPAFADGGRVTSPTLAMFGEYAGAATNPEYALRQDQLLGLMQSGTRIHGTATVKGQDLVIAFNEANRRNNTIFGS